MAHTHQAGFFRLLAGAILVAVIISVVTAYYDNAARGAAAGITIWMKLITDFILSWQAHFFAGNNKCK